MSPWMTIQEVAKWSRASKTVVYKAVKTGDLPARKHGKTVVHIQDLEAWSAARAIKPEVQVLSEFQRARQRVRSLKTRHTDDRSSA